MNPGEQVKHERFGLGSVEYDKGLTVIVRFEHGIEECEITSVKAFLSPVQAIYQEEWHAPLQVITRMQAEAIQSINDAWGVFSPSRIALLPHQLWVCRRVLEKWPSRWLVADDVGLGKTIEAGLILWPLLAKNTVKRLLIICPAGLVEQWQYRLRTMFDIRLSPYVTEADTPKKDFWGTHNQVVASLETLRLGKEGKQKERQDRIFGSPPWDLLIVDEAHHLNADEDAGPTLGYKLAKQLVEQNRVSSMIFFTGTPHRGKNFGFLSILALLRPDLFDPNEPFVKQLKFLPEVMIRNPKNSVTDLKGEPLFRPPIVNSETFSYSVEEDAFYKKLTEFIVTGKAYASSLEATQGRAVMLVLIAMQKLASSSVAAIRKSIKGRLARITGERNTLDQLQIQIEQKGITQFYNEYQSLEKSVSGDEMSKLEEAISILSAKLRLMKNEEKMLQELIALADEVKEETKIEKIMDLVNNEFSDRSILFFTEYKATQSLLMSELIQKFGEKSVAFINGEEKAEDVIDGSGKLKTIYQSRADAADKFNAGEARFLISTEAGGEGIDLQEKCHTLIHVDLPWNPMRLHQRVGRLNRYGQTNQVGVVTLRNPDTVESLIWEKLNDKINNIMLAFSQVMDEPEDLLQLVLGMTSPSLFREVFSEAESVPKEKLSDWFNTKTASFGGRDVLETVKEIVGHCSKFDFQQVSSQIPKLDLPALKPFVTSMLALNNRRVKEDDNGVSFKTPENWLTEPGIRNAYERMIFDRQDKSKDAAQRVLGVGHKLVNQALKQARDSTVCVCSIANTILPDPLLIFRVYDQVTGESTPIRFVVGGVTVNQNDGKECRFLKDWELLEQLNMLANKPSLKKFKTSQAAGNIDGIKDTIEGVISFARNEVKQLALPFKIPVCELSAILWPVSVTDDFEDATLEEIE